MRVLVALVHDEATQSAELSRVLHGLRVKMYTHVQVFLHVVFGDGDV